MKKRIDAKPYNTATLIEVSENNSMICRLSREVYEDEVSDLGIPENITPADILYLPDAEKPFTEDEIREFQVSSTDY